MPTDEQIKKWSKAYDRLEEARDRLKKALKKNAKGLEMDKKDHKEALDAYSKASDELG